MMCDSATEVAAGASLLWLGDILQDWSMPLSFLSDRNKPGPSQTQVGFYDFVVFPLLRTLVRAVPEMEPILKGAIANQERWRQFDRASAAAAQTGTTMMCDSATEVAAGASLLAGQAFYY
uniref:PDEase domain-containing protein n=1 Tax=Spumella elongata TaxID=89044 RepID=A0A7S3HTV2_9STRA|mmetsp:Transcript_8254/g.30165  ORF Transcript_8254/g.30165 Transcript_8254/m.30165 type:complete len:120 (+) Transcript_8254:2215-2574(+)